MKRNHFSTFLMAALVAASLLQAGCGNEITLTVSKTTAKMTVNPKKRDVLHFRHANDTNFAISFRIFSPCSEGMTVKDCTVNVTTKTVARYNYRCSPNVCSDPEVIVGSDGERGELHFVNAGLNPVPAETVDIGCKNSELVLDTEPSPLTAKTNDLIEWIPVGDPGMSEAPTEWSVDVPTGTCYMDMPINQSSPYCQFTAAGATTTFTVHSTQPSCRDATGTITKQQ